MSLAVLQADCKKAIALLAHLSNDDLHDVINDDERTENLLNDIDQCHLKDVEVERQTLLASNQSLAEFNLTREPELVEGREKVHLLSLEGEELAKRVEEKIKELRNKSGDMSLETALALLQTAASEIEEETDALAKKFLDGDTELEEFFDQFLERRKLMHLRLVKAEKMAKILSRDPLSRDVPNYINAPPVNINTRYFPPPPPINTQIPAPNTVPYPAGPFNMPMPMGNYFNNY